MKSNSFSILFVISWAVLFFDAAPPSKGKISTSGKKKWSPQIKYQPSQNLNQQNSDNTDQCKLF